jgi:hypothetical protein
MYVSRIDETEGASVAANIDPGRTREARGGQPADDCRLELGYRRAHPKTVAKLAKALKVKPEDLH